MIASTFYVIAVPDLAESARFYRDVLGFEVREIGDPGWRMYINGQCRIMAGECPDAIPPSQLGDHSYFAYWVIDDVDAYYEKVRQAGVDITKPLNSEAWGMREFGLRTIDGHRIMIGQAQKPE